MSSLGMYLWYQINVILGASLIPLRHDTISPVCTDLLGSSLQEQGEVLQGIVLQFHHRKEEQ